MKKLLSGIFLLTVVFCLLCAPMKLIAANAIDVYLNNQKLNFVTTQPINYNDRVMVPIREIAEMLGFGVQYEDASQLMTFTKTGLVVQHIMYTKVILVNGQAQSFDTPSINRDDRTLMPVRMIAQTLGAEFEYNDTVTPIRVDILISSNPSTEQPVVTTPTPTPTPTPAPSYVKPAVNSVSFSMSEIKSGEEVTVLVNANNQTSRIRFTDMTGAVVAETSDYTTVSDSSRQFKYVWTPIVKVGSSQAFQPITATPGDFNGYNEDGAKFGSMRVVPPPNPQITGISTGRGTVYTNSTITFTVTTNANATRVRISNDYNSMINESVNYTTSGDSRVFKIDVKVERVGSREFTVEVGTDDLYIADSTKTHLVDVVSNAAVGELSIIDISLSPREVRPNNYCTVTVTTSRHATRLVIEDSSHNEERRVSRFVSEDVYEGTKTWEFDIRHTEEGNYNYYVYAYEGSSSSADSVNKRFTIICRESASSNSNNSRIYEITASPSRVSVGGRTEITVITDDDIEWVELYDYRMNLITDRESSYNANKSYGEIEWVFSRVTIENSSFTKFNVRAYYSNNDYVSGSVTVNIGSGSGSGDMIYRVESDKSTYYDGDRVTITVETTDEAEYVTMYNEEMERSYNMRRGSSSGGYIQWTASFTADYWYGQNQSISIETEDYYGYTDYDYITIRVRE